METALEAMHGLARGDERLLDAENDEVGVETRDEVDGELLLRRVVELVTGEHLGDAHGEDLPEVACRHEDLDLGLLLEQAGVASEAYDGPSNRHLGAQVDSDEPPLAEVPPGDGKVLPDDDDVGVVARGEIVRARPQTAAAGAAGRRATVAGCIACVGLCGGVVALVLD